MQDGLERRLVVGVSGQAFSRATYAVTSIGLVPIFIHAWGVDGFGEWLVLTALASYISYSNFGLITTAGNELVMALGAGDLRGAQRIYQMSINISFYLVVPLLGLVVLAAYLLPLAELLNLHQIGQRDAVLIVALEALVIWVGTIRGMMAAALYANGHYGPTYAIAGVAKLLELGAIVLLVTVLGGGQVAAAGAVVGTAILDLAMVAILKQRVSPWARSDFRVLDLSWLATQLKPGLGFLLSNFSTQSVLLQGPRLVLGAVLGGQAVGTYAVFATAMRLIDQAVLLLAMPLEVEVARASGAGDLDRAYRLIVLGTQFAWLAFIGGAAGLLLFGPFVFQAWTAGRIPFDYGLMSLFLVMSASNQLGRISSHALVGTNRTYGPSLVMVPATLAALALGGLLAFCLGVPGMVTGGIAGELAVSVVAIRAVTAWLGRSPGGFLRDLLRLGPAVEYLRTLARRHPAPSG